MRLLVRGHYSSYPVEATDDKCPDFQRLLSEGYVEPKEDDSRSALQLTAKAIAFLGERGAGLNEA